MIKEIIATGADANAAIESGALLLGLPRDEVQFEIIDLPRKGGFLGLKKLPAKVRVWAELPDEKPAKSEKPRRQEAPKKENKPEAKPAPRAERPEKPIKTEKPAAPKREKAEKPERAEKQPREEKPALVEIEPTAEVRAKVEKAAAYVTEILTAMGLSDFTVTPRYYEENVRLQLAGEQIGSVIGRRGETLDAIQYLTSLVANRGEGDYIRLANQAVRTGRSITLEPMNPYERRIIHGAVSTVKGAVSSSTGVEPNRRVVISSTVPPTGGKEGSRSGRGGRGGNRRGNGGRNKAEHRNDGERRSRPAGERRPRLEDPPAIGGPVRREQTPETAPKTEKSTVEQEILSANTGKRYGKIDI